MTTTEQQIRAHVREAIKEVTESHTFTNKHDDDPSLEGGQKKKLPDELQSAIIDADTNENTTPAENEQKENEMKTTEQQIREHVRAAIKEIKRDLNEGEIERMAARAANRTRMIDGSGRAAMYGGRAVGAATASSVAAVAAPFVTMASIALTKEAITQGIFAYKASADADEKAELSMMKSAVNRAWTLSVRRRRSDGEVRGETDLEKDINAMRSWRASTDGSTNWDADAVSQAIGRITQEEWDNSPVEEDPGGYGDVEKAQEQLDTFLNNLPEPEPAEDSTLSEARAHVRSVIKEINEENCVEISKTSSEPKHLSEARQHVRNAINEVMVGLTPITRMNTQGNAKKARKGNNTDTAVDKAELGFNTFDMQEWANIAGIDEKHLTEAISDDTGNSSMLGGSDAPFDNVVGIDIGADEYVSTDKIPGMEVSPVSGDSSWDDGLEDEVEDLADEYLANKADPNVFDIRDFLAEIRKR